MTTTRYAVVGGGIVGASVAYHLSERTDDPIVVYERGELAGETTFKSTSMIGVGGPDPHHRMKRYGFRLYNDFFADSRSAVEYRQAGRLRVATEPGGAARLERLAAGESEEPAVGESPSDGAAAEPSVDAPPASRAKFAHDLTEYVPGDELHASLVLPPLATTEVEGALYRPMYGHVRSDDRTLGARELALEFVERARAQGVTFETDTEVTDVITEDGRVTGIELASDDAEADEVEPDGAKGSEAEAGEVEAGGSKACGAEVGGVGTDRFEPADEVICAAGPWNAELAATVGIELPIEHTLSPVYALDLGEPLPYTLPTIKSHESSVGLHRKRDDRILVTYTPSEDEARATSDPDSVGKPELDAFRETALEWAERLVPRLGDATLADEWVGVGTSTPDGNPIVGRTEVEGLSLAATMIGIQLAPAVGNVVARQLVDGKPTDHYDAVSISRFDGYTDTFRNR